MTIIDSINNDWIFFTEPKTIVSINTFDDGNQRYQDYTNSWFIIGEWRGKVGLLNISNPSIEISSISGWKTTSVDQEISVITSFAKVEEVTNLLKKYAEIHNKYIDQWEAEDKI